MHENTRLISKEQARHTYMLSSTCYRVLTVIHPIHVVAMLKKRGLEGKFARQYVKLDVTSLLLHVPVT